MANQAISRKDGVNDLHIYFAFLLVIFFNVDIKAYSLGEDFLLRQPLQHFHLSHFSPQATKM